MAIVKRENYSNTCLCCYCCCSVTKLYLTVCDPMDCSMPCFPVLHYFLEFASIHVHQQCCLIIASSAALFSFCLQSFLASGSFPISHLQRFVTQWTAACQVPLSSTIAQSLLKFLSMESVRLSNSLILCHPFTFCPQSFPASGSFPMSRFFAPGGQSIKASASVLAMNIQG